MKRRREVTIEIDEVVIRRPRAITLGWCHQCGAQVRMLTPDAAAATVNVSLRTIYRRVEAGRVHYTELPEGSLLVCANSLSQ